MLAFTKEVDEWMAQDNENTVVIHCKGGKGRTETVVCACLIANKSTSTKLQGVETPSQSRYVGYFVDVKNPYNWTLPPIKVLTVKKLIIYSIH
ncbi:hypothetical protein MC885_006230, partial [Smutsia gigantea]